MFGPARILLTIAASTVALPVFAQASVPTTAFDGIYAGVSRERVDEKGVMGIKTCPLGVRRAIAVDNRQGHRADGRL
jgi:hypothetical protein